MIMVRWSAVAGVVAAGAVIFSACGGSGIASKTAAPSSGGAGELSDAAAMFAKSTFQARYTATSSSTTDGLAGGQVLLLKDGDKRLRFEASVAQDGQTMDIIFISTERASGFCLKDAGELGGLLGVEPGKGVCFKASPNDPNNPAADINSLFQDLETTNVTLLDTSSRTIAGQDTTCYRTKDNDSGETDTACLTKDGVLMAVSREGTDAFSMEAADVSRSVSASDFEFPYEVRDLPGSR
jgi:hypothetical protein